MIWCSAIVVFCGVIGVSGHIGMGVVNGISALLVREAV